jgi:Proliferating cell nuclear antigen, N-terminal domain
MSSDYIFFAECIKGYNIKTLIDGLSSTFKRCFFRFLETGIFMKQMDDKKNILFNIELLRENFISFSCEKEISFSINIKHFQRLIKSLKKKNSLSFFIEKNEPSNLGIITKISSESGTAKIKKSFITINREMVEDFDIPTGYKFPKVIKSSEFQDIKSVLSIDKTLKIIIQDSNYLGFKCLLDVYSSGLEFGEITKNTPIYENTYFSSIFNQIIKFPNLSSQMQFYKPPKPRYPLLIKMQIDPLGTIEIYIKDIEECEKQKIELQSIN